MIKRIIQWFIWTDDAYTNQSISKELPSENTSYDTECADGILRNLWVCDGSFVTKMLKNKKSQNFKFKIFKKEGKHGPINVCDFFNKKKK